MVPCVYTCKAIMYARFSPCESSVDYENTSLGQQALQVSELLSVALGNYTEEEEEDEEEKQLKNGEQIQALTRLIASRDRGGKERPQSMIHLHRTDVNC